MEQFSKDIYWILAEDLKFLEGWEKSPRSQVGWKKEERTKQDRTCPLKESWKKSKFFMLWKAPSTSGVISEDREGASETQRKTQQLVCCRQNRERPAQAIWSTTLHVPAWDACPLAQMGARSWSLGFRGQTWRWLELAGQRQCQGAGVWCGHNQGCLWKKLIPPYKQSTIVKWSTKEGSGEAALAPLSPHPSPCLHGLQKSMPQPPAWGFLPQRAPTPQSFPQWALGADASKLPRHRDGNEITAKPQVS